jgi:hypothetical protein
MPCPATFPALLIPYGMFLNPALFPHFAYFLTVFACGIKIVIYI